jgi:Carboxypeptidase regulatory-like domain/TonB dependent receptor
MSIRIRSFTLLFVILCSILAFQGQGMAQAILGGIVGTVKDASGSSIPGAAVTAENIATGLVVKGTSDGNGSYQIPNLPAGTYKLTMTKDGFDTESHTQILVNGDRTTTVDGALKVGQVSTKVEVTATPLMNQVDTTVGYVVDQLTLENTPLGTGSFTQLAIMSPGVHADFLSGTGANAGLGNQAIFANGQRDTSNSFSMNGIDTNNLFNGNSTSNVGENRFVENTGETFGAGGTIITSTSVYTAIGQALPTPPIESIQEIAVNTAMYDSTQGAHSGAHVSIVTKSGGNAIHGALSETFGNSDLSAAAFFYNASPALTTKVPFFNRNQFVGAIGGPIKKDKLFYFLSYQGIRVADAYSATSTLTVPLQLTNDRSLQGILNTLQAEYPTTTISASQISAPALALLQQKTPNGQFFIPTPTITNLAQAKALGYDSVLTGPNATANVNQGIANIDYVVNDKDRLAVKYYVQQDPTNNPFAPADALIGFGQNINAGSDVGALSNTVILAPTLTWTQKIGFTRMLAYANDSQAYTPSQFGINQFGGQTFPEIEIGDADPGIAKTLEFGNSQAFGNEGMFQNQWEYGSTLNWVKGRHTLSFGAQVDAAQLNVLNHNTNTDTIDFTSFLNFAEGNVRTGKSSEEFSGSASRYYRSTTVGLFANDNWKVRSNLTVTLGLRWDFEGPLTEKYGQLTAFNPSLYAYNATTDTVTNSGLEVAANNATFGTKGAGNSLLKQHQYGFAPRVGIAYSPTSKLTIRTGFGTYYDRGELFSEFSPSAGGGFNGPFGVTLAEPFVQPVEAVTGATLANPFGTAPPATPAGSAAAFTALLPGIAQTIAGKFPAGNLFGPFLYGGYDINNKLPYTVNWSFDLQYQLSNSWLFSAGYVGNHGSHEVIPIPFNQPGIATATNPINGQTSSYGVNQSTSPTTPILTSEFAGNAPVRVPFIGYDLNSVSYEAVGSSNYDALQLQARKRLSSGLALTASYTWSHSLDEQSGLGLFFTGNNANNPKSNYASSDFDRTHVFLLNASYAIPKLTTNKSLGYLANGWMISGQTVAQSGEPYSVYDFSGSVGSLYYGTDIELVNPIVPLTPGATAQSAQLQGTLGVNAGKPVLNVNDFAPQFVAPGTNGVPAGDVFESLFGGTGRNIFRGPFQFQVDTTLAKEFMIAEKYRLRLNFNVYNLFNHPDFDAPNNDVTFFNGFAPPPVFPPSGSLGIIQHTIGSPRFLQLAAHFTF